MISRRVFIKNGGITLLGLGVIPNFLYRAAMAARNDSTSGKVLVILFLRGGADGLNIIVPFREEQYYSRRPSIAISPPSRSDSDAAIDLDGQFGLHPALQSLHRLFSDGHLGIVHAVGSPYATRSHFDAQDFIESGVPGDKSVVDGWVNRYLGSHPRGIPGPFRGVSLERVLPRSLKGGASAVAVGNLNRFGLRGDQGQADSARTVYQTLYDKEADALLSGTAAEMFEAIDSLRRANPGQYRPAPGADYPAGRLGQKMRQVAQLIKADLGMEVACVDVGGWDHHVNEGGSNGQLSNLLRQLGDSLAAFHKDLQDQMDDIVILTVSEFGRTAHENGNRGTDHGSAGFMLALGGPVRGGKVAGRWPGLEREQLFEGRDLAVTTDFRAVFSEVLQQHLGANDLLKVFPGYKVDASKFLKLL